MRFGTKVFGAVAFLGISLAIGMKAPPVWAQPSLETPPETLPEEPGEGLGEGQNEGPNEEHDEAIDEVSHEPLQEALPLVKVLRKQPLPNLPNEILDRRIFDFLEDQEIENLLHVLLESARVQNLQKAILLGHFRFASLDPTPGLLVNYPDKLTALLALRSLRNKNNLTDPRERLRSFQPSDYYTRQGLARENYDSKGPQVEYATDFLSLGILGGSNEYLQKFITGFETQANRKNLLEGISKWTRDDWQKVTSSVALELYSRLIKSSRHDDPLVRVGAVKTLGKFHFVHATGVLEERCWDQDIRVRDAAIRALSRFYQFPDVLEPWQLQRIRRQLLLASLSTDESIQAAAIVGLRDPGGSSTTRTMKRESFTPQGRLIAMSWALLREARDREIPLEQERGIPRRIQRGILKDQQKLEDAVFDTYLKSQGLLKAYAVGAIGQWAQLGNYHKENMELLLPVIFSEDLVVAEASLKVLHRLALKWPQILNLQVKKPHSRKTVSMKKALFQIAKVTTVGSLRALALRALQASPNCCGPEYLLDRVHELNGEVRDAALQLLYVRSWNEHEMDELIERWDASMEGVSQEIRLQVLENALKTRPTLTTDALIEWTEFLRLTPEQAPEIRLKENKTVLSHFCPQFTGDTFLKKVMNYSSIDLLELGRRCAMEGILENDALAFLLEVSKKDDSTRSVSFLSDLTWRGHPLRSIAKERLLELAKPSQPKEVRFLAALTLIRDFDEEELWLVHILTKGVRAKKGFPGVIGALVPLKLRHQEIHSILWSGLSPAIVDADLFNAEYRSFLKIALQHPKIPDVIKEFKLLNGIDPLRLSTLENDIRRSGKI